MQLSGGNTVFGSREGRGVQRYRGVLVEGSTPEEGGRVGQKTKTKKM